VNLTALWRFLIGVCELIHILLMYGKAVVLMLKMLWATL